jgi:hypothetical protein
MALRVSDHDLAVDDRVEWQAVAGVHELRK